jgi:hypothetical protein
MDGFQSVRRSRWTTLLALSLSAAAMAGCRVSQDDVHRWEGTQQGPDKLVAVLLHDKYDLPLRVEAAMSLVRMKPRAGRRIGITKMVETLEHVTPEARQAIVAGLLPELIAELQKPPPVAQAGQATPPDGSYPYKDTAYALLNAKDPPIVTDPALKASLKSALIQWALADFEHRLNNRTQTYGMEQLLRLVDESSGQAVAGLPALMTRDARNLDPMASLVAELGDAKTKLAASTALTDIAKFVNSDAWLKLKTPDLQASNAASKLEPTEKQFQAQLLQFQEEELMRVFGTLKKIGGRPVVDYLLGFAATKEFSEKRRQAAVAALEGRLDRNNPQDIQRIFDLAKSPDTPDVVLDQAFRRIGEMPREQVATKLYELFSTDKWKLRRQAASTLLKMSTVGNIDEFISKIDTITKGFAMSEALVYGAYLGDLKGGSVAEGLKKHLTSGGPAARTSAIGYYYTFGTPTDLPVMQSLENDTAKAPVCETDPDCKWSCEIAKAGSKEREAKDITTIGDFVKYCVEPAMRERKTEAKKDTK